MRVSQQQQPYHKCPPIPVPCRDLQRDGTLAKYIAGSDGLSPLEVEYR